VIKGIVQHATTRVALTTAGIGLMILMSLVTAGAFATKDAANRGSASINIFDAYQHAATAVAAEESLERKYRLEPGPVPMAGHTAAEKSLVSAMDQVDTIGDATDRRLATTVLREHRAYVKGSAALFALVDRHAPVAAINALDTGTVDPIFGTLEAQVDAAAKGDESDALSAASSMRTTGGVVLFLDFGALFAAAALVSATGLVIARYQRHLERDSQTNRHQALHDSLTDLPNRVLFNDRCSVALRASHRTGVEVATLILDLDRFKDVNDTLGHQYGDELLVQVAERLTSTLRAAGTIARLGGDEFAVLLPESGWVDAIEVAERIGASLKEPFTIHDVALDVEASIGIALAGAGEDVDTLMRRADVAMYEAKGGHRPFACYEPSRDDNSRTRLALLGDLRRAIASGQLVLYYQPKIHAETGAVTSVEALVRWAHPTRGLVMPDSFVPIAENTAIIHSLTTEVLRIALRQARQWADDGHPIPIAVNISARSLLDGTFPAQIAALLESNGVSPSLLTLELTESAIMSDPNAAITILGAINALGVALSIDDFGTGYSSMAYLKTLPVQEIKVDRSFVMAMTGDTDNAVIVQSTIELGHNLGLRVVAEGVEDAATRAALTNFGCDYLQGYGICRPVPVEELNQWLSGQIIPTVVLL
jgi:diguanylate cyclase (GGDEF)-like protein